MREGVAEAIRSQSLRQQFQVLTIEASKPSDSFAAGLRESVKCANI
jgi:hypothetical protein